MDEKFDELKSVLSHELEIYESLVKTADQMNQAIKQKEVDDVKQLTSRFDTYIEQVDMLESRRLEICDAIAREIKSEKQHMNLHNIITLLPKEKQQPFLEIRTSLKFKINELSKVNISNQLLLKESLIAIGKKFELILQSQNSIAGYKHTGNMDKEPIRKNIFNHIA